MNNLQEEIKLPAILNIPPKLMPLITDIDSYNYFLIEGGRVSAKSQTAGRLISVLGEMEKLTIVCGREIQNDIKESVYALLKNLILEYKLNYRIYAERLVHRVSGTEITFKGFREKGKVSIKGLEGVDVLWIDEAQSITAETLKIIIPTIREQNAKVYYTMNRYLKHDPIFVEFADREDCLHIHIDYFENPFCPQKSINEAMLLKSKNIEDYRHHWLGIPMDQANSAGLEALRGLLTIIYQRRYLLIHDFIMS